MSTDNLEELGSSDSYNFRQLLDTLMETRDFIATVPEDQVQELRDGLQDRKAKDNIVLKKNGLIPMTDALVFTVYPAMDKNKKILEGQMCVRVRLVPRRSVDIIRLELPTDEL